MKQFPSPVRDFVVVHFQVQPPTAKSPWKKHRGQSQVNYNSSSPYRIHRKIRWQMHQHNTNAPPRARRVAAPRESFSRNCTNAKPRESLKVLGTFLLNKQVESWNWWVTWLPFRVLKLPDCLAVLWVVFLHIVFFFLMTNFRLQKNS